MNGRAMSGMQRAAPVWYAVFYALCIAAMGALTMTTARSMSDHRAWLPVLEIIGVVLLLVRRTAIAGVVLLLVVYGFAAVHSLHSGHIPLDLVLYAGTAVFIAQLRALPAGAGRGRGRGAAGSNDLGATRRQASSRRWRSSAARIRERRTSTHS